VIYTNRKSINKNDIETLDQFDRNDTRVEGSYKIEISQNKASIAGVGSSSIDSIVQYLDKKSFQGLVDTVSSIAKSGTVAESTLLKSYIYSLNFFLSIEKTSSITAEAISDFHELCRSRKKPAYYFTGVKQLLLKWHEYGYYGIDDEVADFLLEVNSPVNNRPSGSRIRSDNPEEGWYTDQEYDDLVEAIWNDYELDIVVLQKTLALLLGAQYGRRPIQIAHLKVGDIRESGEACGVSGKRIEFPSAKNRNTGGGFRSGKLEVHPLGDELWKLCQLQIKQSQSIWEEAFQSEITSKNVSKLPLFHMNTKHSSKKRVELAYKNSSQTDTIYASRYLHVSSHDICGVLTRGSRGRRFGTRIVSERTGKQLIENAYRFRFTRVRQLARLGVPRITLQYWMGHEDIKSLEAYYDDPAERARVLDETINPLLAPLAQAFQGTLINSEADAIRANDPSSRIRLDGKKALSVGSCGEHGFCSASVPIPCYRCSKFQPWVYGPHTEVLERLLERQRLENEAPLIGQGRRLLIPVQLKKEINAVRVVIESCEKRKIELEQING